MMPDHTTVDTIGSSCALVSGARRRTASGFRCASWRSPKPSRRHVLVPTMVQAKVGLT